MCHYANNIIFKLDLVKKLKNQYIDLFNITNIHIQVIIKYNI